MRIEDGGARSEKATDETTGAEAGLVLVVPVGRDLNLFEMRLAGLERLLERKRIKGLRSGVSAMAAFWLEALRGAELRAGTTRTNKDEHGLTQTREQKRGQSLGARGRAVQSPFLP